MTVGDTRHYDGITPSQWQCIKATSTKEHSTKYVEDPPDPTRPDCESGIAQTHHIVEVDLKYRYCAHSETLDYTIAVQGFPATDSEIWGGADGTVNDCKGK